MLRTLALLATLVCAEGETTTPEDRRAIAATVMNRALANQTSIEQEMFSPSQYAPLSYCDGGATIQHAVDAAAGAVGIGLPEWWTDQVMNFVAPYALARIAPRWKRRLDKAGSVPRGHIYWKKRG